MVPLVAHFIVYILVDLVVVFQFESRTYLPPSCQVKAPLARCVKLLHVESRCLLRVALRLTSPLLSALFHL